MFNKVHPQLLGVLDGSNSFEGHLRLLGGVECRGKHIVKNSPISQCSLAKTESTKGAGAKGNTVYTQCHNAFLQKSPLSISVQTNFIVMSTIAIHSSLFCVTSIPLKLLQRNIEDQQTHGWRVSLARHSEPNVYMHCLSEVPFFVVPIVGDFMPMVQPNTVWWRSNSARFRNDRTERRSEGGKGVWEWKKWSLQTGGPFLDIRFANDIRVFAWPCDIPCGDPTGPMFWRQICHGRCKFQSCLKTWYRPRLDSSVLWQCLNVAVKSAHFCRATSIWAVREFENHVVHENLCWWIPTKRFVCILLFQDSYFISRNCLQKWWRLSFWYNVLLSFCRMQLPCAMCPQHPPFWQLPLHFVQQ